MSDETIVAADVVLRRHGIRYVVVGGQAVAREAATTTHDIDVMVTTADYKDAIARLKGDPELILEFEGEQVTRFSIRPMGRVPLDLINAGAFSGTKAGGEFFEFLVREETSEAGGIRYASAQAVWYTRLLTKRWKAYGEKILTNVVDGLSADRLDAVEEIARRFGTDGVIRTRIAYVREELKRPDLATFLRGD